MIENDVLHNTIKSTQHVIADEIISVVISVTVKDIKRKSVTKW